MATELNIDEVVRQRYEAGAASRQDSLCCPVSYDPRYLEVIPREVIERDYGCGDPTPYLQPGDTVLDLGSGGGKTCFVAAQIVGPSGRVIGIDVNAEMLALARRHAPSVAEKLGFGNVEFRTVEGIEFRSITVRAFKGKQGACLDCNQAVIYRGPWRKVEDDDGHTLTRGQPMAVCEKTFGIYSSAPYSEEILPVPPLEAVAPESAPVFDCSRDTARHPRETKGLEYRTTTNGNATCCGPDGCS